MHRQRGFTLVEIVVTLTIIVTLMVFAVANVRSSQVKARDYERQSDAENMARQLDSLYTKGFTYNYSGTISFIGSYPNATHMSDGDVVRTVFEAIPKETFIAPGKSSAEESFFVANNDSESTSLVDPQPSSDQPYVYQPISTTLYSGSYLCSDIVSQTCRRFNLYYWIEDTNSVGMIKGANR